jgi:hypothetical protein
MGPPIWICAQASGTAIAIDPDMVNVLAVLACPSCPTNIEARALVLSDAFLSNATYAALPFLVVGFVVYKFVKRLDRGARDDEHA